MRLDSGPACVRVLFVLGLLAGVTAAQTSGLGDLIRAELRIGEGEGQFTGDLDGGDRFGAAVAAMGDWDGDMVPDVVVCAPGDDTGGSNRGAAWLLLLRPDGTSEAALKIASGAPGLALDNGDAFGTSAVSVGDMDGDFIGDIAIGAPGDDDFAPGDPSARDGENDTGAVYIVYMNADGTVKGADKISASSGGFDGALDSGDAFGGSLTTIDVDQDGRNELVVGASGDDDGGRDRGAIWILYLGDGNEVVEHQKISNEAGGLGDVLLNFDRFGTSVASLTDVDGDQVPDLAVGSPRDDDGARGDDEGNLGAVWILLMRPNGTVEAPLVIRSGQGGFDGLLESGDLFGSALAAVPDGDGDGKQELMVGAIGHVDEGDDDDVVIFAEGAVWLLYLGDGNPIVKNEMRISRTSGGLDGPLDPLDEFGHGIAYVGDDFGDTPLVSVGAPGDAGASGPGRAANQGVSWQLFGQGGQIINPGSGINPLEFNPDVLPPRIGQIWKPFVTPPPAGGGRRGEPEFNWGGISKKRFNRSTGGGLIGELLISISSNDLLLSDISETDQTFCIPIPPIPALIGLELFSQAAVFEDDGSIVLQNGIDLVIGL